MFDTVDTSPIRILPAKNVFRALLWRLYCTFSILLVDECKRSFQHHLYISVHVSFTYFNNIYNRITGIR